MHAVRADDASHQPDERDAPHNILTAAATAAAATEATGGGDGGGGGDSGGGDRIMIRSTAAWKIGSMRMTILAFSNEDGKTS
jgi:hypothetical protein